MGKQTNEYRFSVTGGFDVNKKLKCQKTAIGEVYGFLLPDGRMAELVVALEVVDPKETDDDKRITYITNDLEMAELGFEALDYDELNFTPTGVKNKDAHIDEYVEA